MMRSSVVLVTLLGGCALRMAHGNGVERTAERSLPAFDEIENEGGVDVRIVEGPRGATVTCDENLLHLIRTDVNGTELEIDVPNGTLLMPTVPCVVEISAPRLTSIATTGSGWVEADGTWPELRQVTATGSGGVVVDGGAFPALEEIRVSGSGDVELAGIASPFLDTSISGSGTVTLHGVVDDLALDVSGSGAVFARDLTTIDADIAISGSGDIELTATGFVTGRISGSGNLTVWGHPQIDVETSGSGDVNVE
jgi:hypothetical protein